MGCQLTDSHFYCRFTDNAGASENRSVRFCFYGYNRTVIECRLSAQGKISHSFLFFCADLPQIHSQEVTYMDYSENIRRTKEYIAKHLSEELTAEEIAAYAGYSTFHYCRIFKEYTGKSLMRYVREKRLEAAEKEIKNGEPTAEVAQRSGFETTSGFSRAYKKKFGKRPAKEINA